MVNYANSVIYTITSGGKVYVGSTTCYANRKYQHKYSLKHEPQKQPLLYNTIIEHDYEWSMQPHKIFPCHSKMELQIEEENVRKELNAELNAQRCHLTRQDYLDYKKTNSKNFLGRNPTWHQDNYKRNKERISIQQKQYQGQNKAKISARKAIYYQQKKEKVAAAAAAAAASQKSDGDTVDLDC